MSDLRAWWPPTCALALGFFLVVVVVFALVFAT